MQNIFSAFKGNLSGKRICGGGLRRVGLNVKVFNFLLFNQRKVVESLIFYYLLSDINHSLFQNCVAGIYQERLQNKNKLLEKQRPEWARQQKA